MSNKFRLRFCKEGKAKYISHLDLMATMRRALLRAGLRLKYSEGFNPHPLMSIALPLSIACGSVCELMDFELAAGDVPEGFPVIISELLPEGLTAYEVYSSTRKFSEIKWIELEGQLHYDKGMPVSIIRMLEERLQADSIIIIKKTKRSNSEFDIAPHIRDVAIMENGGLTIRVKVSAQNPTINAENLLSAFGANDSDCACDCDNYKDCYCKMAPDFAQFRRLEIFDADLKVFR